VTGRLETEAAGDDFFLELEVAAAGERRRGSSV
jgi:hypothetical protein